MTKVALLKVPDYREDRVQEALEVGIKLLGLEEDFFSDKKVLLKPNLLTSFGVERGACSQPEVVRSAALAVLQRGGKVSLGDSPGFENLERVAKASGITEKIKDLDIPLVSFDAKKIDVKFPEGILSKSFPLGAPVVETDLLVNLARLKTHSFTGYSGAVKNLYGCLSGRSKMALHMRYYDIREFSRMLADLAGFLRPGLSVVDGIVSMEGPGPRRGTPRSTGFLVMSRDPVAADAVACSLVGIKPEEILHLKYAGEAGFGTVKLDALELVGDLLEELKVTGFKKAPTHKAKRGFPPGFLVRIFRDYFVSYPLVERGKCVGCRVCAEHCPAGIIEMKEKKAVIEYSRCIRCYCCHELCPHEAVGLKRRFQRPGSLKAGEGRQ